MNFKLVSNYKQNEVLRSSFNELTQKTFGFNFIEWYQKGFWTEQYIPYSLIDNDKVIANVSVNLMDLVIDGVKKRYIQLGTVMTDQEYRKQGLGRYIMEAVLKEYKDSCDGIYLFANNSAVEFYPKFGFTKSKEYQYSKKISFNQTIRSIIKVDMTEKHSMEKVLDTIRKINQNNNLHMDNYGLYTFYAACMMREQVYYCEKEDAYVVADIQKKVLYLNQIIAKHKVDLDSVIADFGNEINEVVLGFVPLDTFGYEISEFKDEDLTLYIMGEDLGRIEKEKLRFPLLSHA